jgi:hypothetical protein
MPLVLELLVESLAMELEVTTNDARILGDEHRTDLGRRHPLLDECRLRLGDGIT